METEEETLMDDVKKAIEDVEERENPKLLNQGISDEMSKQDASPATIDIEQTGKVECQHQGISDEEVEEMSKQDASPATIDIEQTGKVECQHQDKVFDETSMEDVSAAPIDQEMTEDRESQLQDKDIDETSMKDVSLDPKDREQNANLEYQHKEETLIADTTDKEERENPQLRNEEKDDDKISMKHESLASIESENGENQDLKHQALPSVEDVTTSMAAINLQEPSTQQNEGSIDELGSDFSEIPSEPGKPIEIESSSNSITLAWDAPLKGDKYVTCYEIKYRECNKKGAKWIPVLTETKRRTVVVPDLKCGMDYELKIRAVNGEGEEGPFSQAVKLATNLSLAKSVQITAKKIKDGNPAVFKLPLTFNKQATNFKAKTRKCIFGQGGFNNIKTKEKTIMLVGATGSGKSTLIDGMINYITDVSWEDDFRFSLVDLTDEEKGRHKNQADSQTEWITCYTIHKMDGSVIDYDLNIIDTPGFGDTRGIIRDKAIVDQIREFFTNPGDQGIAFLDAVCFVTQAPMARMTPAQRYIFDAILSVFGQDIASNIFVLITFADGNKPPVLDALAAANVPFKKTFKFNNSALFASVENSDEAKFGNLFWKMGQESFRIFFDELKFVESRSLQLTTEVLQLRNRLEATVQGLQPQITEGMNKLNTIRQEQEILRRHKRDIEANRNFTYTVDEIHMKKIDLQAGTYVTNCMTCNRTCHYPCGIPDDQGKHGCWAMTGENCRVCPNKCHWTMHKNNSFRFETYPVKVTKNYDELKKKYEVAQEEEKKQKSVLSKVKSAFTSLGSKVMTMVHDVRLYLNKLNEIALRPNPLSDIDYIDLLIDAEKNEKKYGWQERLRLLYDIRGQAELVARSAQSNFDPWGQHATHVLQD